MYADERPERIRFGGGFDLVWCGSLLTHLPIERWSGFLDLFASALEPGGLLIFTTMGRLPAAWIERGLVHYGLGEHRARELASDFARDGVAYADYPNAPRYGICLASPLRVVSQVSRIQDLRLVHYCEAAWDDHQDVVAYHRMDGPPREMDHMASERHRTVLRILRETERR